MRTNTLHKYWKTTAIAAAGYADSPLFLMDYLLRFLRVAVLLSIWRTILTPLSPLTFRGEVGGRFRG